MFDLLTNENSRRTGNFDSDVKLRRVKIGARLPGSVSSSLGHCLTFTLAHWLRRSFSLEICCTIYSYSVKLRPIKFMAVWFTPFLHERIELVLTPVVSKYFSDLLKINSAVLKVKLIKPWVNINLSTVKTERKVEWQRAGLSFLISGVPWTCSCFKLTSVLEELF